jgi:hypothetical protein
MRSHLEKAQQAGVPWEYYLAPIVTHPGENPQVTGWVIHLDDPDPIQAEIVWDCKAVYAASQANTEEALPPSFASMSAKLQACQKVITDAATDPNVDEQDRQFNANVLRTARHLYIEQQLRKQLKAVGSSNGQDARMMMLPAPGRKPRTRHQ